MKLISSTAVMLCICTVACVLVKFLVPDGVTKKTLNLIISTVLVIAMISPVKALFNDTKINIKVPSETEITEDYNKKIIATTKTNLEKSVKEVLLQNNISINNVNVTLKTTDENSIIIDSISIYITKDNQSESSAIITLIKENYSVTPQIILE